MRCQFCPYEARLKAQLFAHVKAFHLDVNDVPCPHCDYKGLNEQIVSAHMRNVHFKTVFTGEIERQRCPVGRPSVTTKAWATSISTAERAKLEQGRRKVGRVKDPLADSEEAQCPECDYRGLDEQIVSAHIRNQHRAFERYDCDKCLFVTGRRQNLAKHKREIHSDTLEEDFACVNNCSFATTSGRRYWDRTKHCHKDMKKCGKCSFQTKLSKNLKSHIEAVHGGKVNFTFACHKCPYTSDNINTMNAHQRQKGHGGTRDYKCNACNFIGQDENIFERHHCKQLRQGHIETEHRMESKPDLLQPIHSSENTSESILKLPDPVGQRNETGNAISQLMPNMKEEEMSIG